MTEFKYRAFISYSWADAAWGKWLQRRLETYRTPAGLVGKEGTHGPVRARLHPIFRDREDQSAGASISASLIKGLAESEFLIVICSPNSARSQWCEQEIAWFKTHRDPDKILALIVEGEPGDPERNCFPKALTQRVNEDLTVSDDPVDAPLAADARMSGDGKRRALMKIIGAMLGVGLDELVNRDERRRTIRTRMVVGASLTLALVMSGLTFLAIQARDEAEFQRNEADGLVEFMLTDLRERLEPVGRLDALDVVGDRALDYYAKQELGDLDADALGRRSNALLLVGEVSNIRGDSDAALKSFREAAATTGELLARDPDNAQRVYDHAQSVFWVGAIAYGRGELEDAEARFREYKRLADRLVALDRDKPEWQLESSYAETNLGVMYQQQRRFAEAETAFERGLERIEAVAKSEGYDPGRQVELGMAVNWLGLARGEQGKHKDALDLHQREVAIYDELLRRDPDNAQARNRLAIAQQFVGEQQFAIGNIAEGITAYDRSMEINSRLRDLEPGNTEWQETAVRAQVGQAEQFLYAGRYEDSEAMLAKSRSMLTAMIAADPENEFWKGELRFAEARLGTMLALARGNTDEAQKQARRMQQLNEASGEKASGRHIALEHRLWGDLHRRAGRGERARAAWSKALAALPDHSQSLERFILLKRLGRTRQAGELAAALDRRGFRHPAYLSER